MAEPLFLMREEISVVMPEPYCKVPPPKVILPEAPSPVELPITTVPALMVVFPE